MKKENKEEEKINNTLWFVCVDREGEEGVQHDVEVASR